MSGKFHIETSNPVSAFIILTPHFMEIIVDADRQAQGKTYMCFNEKQVHIALDNGRDLFEVVERKEVVQDISALRERHLSEIKYLTDIMDLILGNEKLF